MKSLTIRNQLLWIACGALASLSILSVAFGSVPTRIKSDPAIYQELHELNIKRERGVDFDSDLKSLAKKEKAFQVQEKQELAALSKHPRLRSVIQRIEQRSYKPKSK